MMAPLHLQIDPGESGSGIPQNRHSDAVRSEKLSEVTRGRDSIRTQVPSSSRCIKKSVQREPVSVSRRPLNREEVRDETSIFNESEWFRGAAG
jgi:hypothetical protein